MDTLTTYIVYGLLAPRETRRRLRPGGGREEILFLFNGQIKLEGSDFEAVTCNAGSVVPLLEGSDSG